VIPAARVQVLNPSPVQAGDYVLYWMQASVRASYNHALEFAIEQANTLKKPLVVFFGITEAYPGANLRHYVFMLEGLEQASRALAKRGIQLVVRRESPENGVVRMARRACLVVVDRGYTRIQRRWRQTASEALDRALIQVESDVVVPVQEASGKEEYAAATLRPKLMKHLRDYLIPLSARVVGKDSLGMSFASFSLEDPAGAARSLDIDRSVHPVSGYPGGYGAAARRLAKFLDHRLDSYAELSRDPGVEGLSGLSPYLHFGHISPLEIALKVNERGSPGGDAFLEELIVRRELSVNFVFYCDAYDSFACLPEWCRKTLHEHAGDRREYLYSEREWETAQTHDPYWNAAQQEMVQTGKMHGYMRMYWGKKILEWSETPESAFGSVLRLNNTYELDGRDPNGFAGTAWCFGKHDRPWKERPIFGKVRYMNSGGLRRKFDMDAYLRRIESLTTGV